MVKKFINLKPKILKLCHIHYASFFLFLVVFKNYFTDPVDNETVRLRLALAIPTGTPITVANDAIKMLPLAADETIKDLSK